jgi:hypothetical protein
LWREESIKLKPGWVDCGSFLRLQDSWAKGDKYREVPGLRHEYSEFDTCSLFPNNILASITLHDDNSGMHELKHAMPF